MGLPQGLASRTEALSMTVYERALANVRKELRYIAKVAVYFALDERNGDIKIGFSTQVENRLYLLGSQYWTTMKLLGWLPGGPGRERKMHAKFDAYALGHEWFEPAPELLAFIEAKTRHDAPRSVHSKYGRINDTHFTSLLQSEQRYMELVALEKPT